MGLTGNAAARGVALGTIDQVTPFHCSTNVLLGRTSSSGPASESSPTATHFEALVHATPRSSAVKAFAGIGLGTIDQAVPSHRSTSAAVAPSIAERLSAEPVAKQLASEVHEIENSSAPIGEAAFGATDQLVPSKRSMTPSVPTAKHDDTLGHDTASSATPTGSGPETIDQAVPSQRSISGAVPELEV